MTDFFSFLLVGLVAGWLAGKIMRKGGFGLLGNLIIGVIGAVLGGYIFEFIGIPARGLPATLVSAVVGAVVFLYLVQFLKRI